MASSSASSAGVRRSSAAVALSARYFGVLVPGMGTTYGPWATSQARATCAGVASIRSVASRPLAAMSRLARRLWSWKRGSRRRRSFRGSQSNAANRPARKPRPRGE